MDSGEFSQATCCGEGICHAGRSGRQRPGTMVWLEISNVGQLCPTFGHFSKPRPDLLSIADWKDWKGLLYECLWWFMMTMFDNHDRCWSSVNVSGRREAWKWTAKQTRQRWAKLVTHSDTTLRKSHDLKQKRDLSCRRDAGLTELIKNEDIVGESALSS